MNSRTQTIAAIIGASTLLMACGDDSNSKLIGLPVGTPTSPRTVEIAMVDIGFEPAAVNVRPGETIRFAFVNRGVLPHEAIFGDGAVQDEHETQMQSAAGSPDGMDMGDTTDTHADDTMETDMGDTTDTHADDTTDMDMDMDMDMDHDELGGPPSISLEPGEIGEIIMTFDGASRAGTIIGCHEPDHWVAGMRLDVTIESA